MLEPSERALDTIDSGFGGRRVLVVGDLMLDRNLWGVVERISPEAPVPVVRLDHETETPGGAANVANNLAMLGLDTSVSGFVGRDQSGEHLLGLLDHSSIQKEAVVSLPDRPTITKTRVMGGHQQMIRLDTEELSPVSPDEALGLLKLALLQLKEGAAAAVLSDYAKGALTAHTCQELIQEANSLNIPILVDPKGSEYSRYRGATVLSPNRLELAAATGISADDLDSLLVSGAELRKALDVKYMVVTLGEGGMVLIDDQATRHVPAVAREVFDVTGAGDTVIATLAACLADGLDMLEAVRIASVAAGLVVGKVGTVPVTRDELIEAMSLASVAGQSSKVCRLESLLSRAKNWRACGEKIVFTNGCFDLLHIGHIALLKEARKQGARLVVGLNSDSSVSRLKGEPRPVVPQQDRSHVLAALESVDAVVIFNDDTPIDIIRALRPDVLVKGSDYTEEQVVGAQEVKSWGGKVALVPLVEGYSTTKLLDMARTPSAN